MLRVHIPRKYLAAGWHGCCFMRMRTRRKHLLLDVASMTFTDRVWKGRAPSPRSGVLGFTHLPLQPHTPSFPPCSVPQVFLVGLIIMFSCPLASKWVLGDRRHMQEISGCKERKICVTVPAGPWFHNSLVYLPMAVTLGDPSLRVNISFLIPLPVW